MERKGTGRAVSHRSLEAGLRVQGFTDTVQPWARLLRRDTGHTGAVSFLLRLKSSGKQVDAG